jgi:hypothetical protein
MKMAYIVSAVLAFVAWLISPFLGFPEAAMYFMALLVLIGLVAIARGAM